MFTVPVDEIDDFLEQNTLPIGTRGQLILMTLRDKPIRLGARS